MKSIHKSLLITAIVAGAFVANTKAGSFYKDVTSGWQAGFVYSVPSGASVEADAVGGNTWAQTEVSGCGVGDGGLGVTLEAGYCQVNYWIGTTTSAGDIYYNLTADGDGAEALLAVSW